MTAPKRIQRRRTKGWRMPEGAVYVGRPTAWGNPDRVGDQWMPTASFPVFVERGINAAEATQAFAIRMTWGDHPASWLAPLRGHDLACWCQLCPRHADGLPLGESCADCAPCHADVLLELANR